MTPEWRCARSDGRTVICDSRTLGQPICSARASAASRSVVRHAGMPSLDPTRISTAPKLQTGLIRAAPRYAPLSFWARCSRLSSRSESRSIRSVKARRRVSVATESSSLPRKGSRAAGSSASARGAESVRVPVENTGQNFRTLRKPQFADRDHAVLQRLHQSVPARKPGMAIGGRTIDATRCPRPQQRPELCHRQWRDQFRKRRARAILRPHPAMPD